MFESSYGVPGMSMQQAQRVCTKYKQESVIYMGPETDGMVALVHEGNMLEPLGQFTPSKIADAYSEIRGRPFVFEWNTQSWGEAMLEQAIMRELGRGQPARPA